MRSILVALPFVCAGCSVLLPPDRPALVPAQDKAEAAALAPVVEQHLEHGDLDSAAERSRMLVLYDPVTPEISVLAARGIAAKAKRDGDSKSYEDAVKLARNAVEASPRDVSTQMVYADLQLGRQYFTAALSGYRTVLELDPKSIAARRGIAFAHRGLRQPKAERQAWEEVLSAAPDDAEGNARLGFLLLQGAGGEGTDEEAERGRELLQRAVTVNSNDAYTLQVVGLLEAESGDLDAAEGHLRRALVAAVGNDTRLENDAAFNLAVLTQARGRMNEARDLYERCLLLDGNDVRATTNLGFLLVDQGATVQGRALLNEALALGVDKKTATAIRAKLDGGSP
ncbi:MAG: hypothetical protein IPH13_05980 [Planctomycetes bacterium]|nr:hypothetical protein [Planctomycetota bacterium]